MALESCDEVGHHQHSDREKQKAQERGMVKSTMAQLFHRTITQARGKLEGSKETSPDSRFFSFMWIFFYNEKTLMCFSA